MSRVPDHLPDENEMRLYSEAGLCARCASEIEAVLERYRMRLTLASRIGIVETVKHELIRTAIDRSEQESDDDE